MSVLTPLIAADEAIARMAVGSLDADAVPAFRVALFDLVDRARGTVVVDLSETDILHAGGAAVLVCAARRLAGRGGRLILCAPGESVLATLVAHGLHRQLSVRVQQR